MKHPSSKQVLFVINNFKKILPLAILENHLNMRITHVNECNRHQCGTIHCHGGWYAIARCNLNNEISFKEGANMMAIDLGFNEYNCNNIFIDILYSLIEWANENQTTWGNRWGGVMFTDSIAFFHPSKRPNGAQNLQHIIDHWTEVYERLLALENQVEISEPPITAERLIEHLEVKINIDATNSVSR